MTVLRSLCTKLEAESNEMKEALKKLEQGRRERDEARKKLLLAEIKAVIATLHETDKNLIKDMKSEVFDKLRDISKVEKDAKDIILLEDVLSPKPAPWPGAWAWR